MTRHLLRLFIVIILIASVFSCSSNRKNANSASDTTLTDRKLEQFLEDVDAWPQATTNYPAASWSRLISMAQFIQGCSSASIEKTLGDFEFGTNFDNGEFRVGPKGSQLEMKEAMVAQYPRIEKGYENNTRLLLLMRIIFDLPENAAQSDRVWYFQWSQFQERLDGTLMYLDENADGTINMAWPISWREGNPVLLSEQTLARGIGRAYDVVGEYKYFRTHFPMRDLKVKEVNSTRQP